MVSLVNRLTTQKLGIQFSLQTKTDNTLKISILNSNGWDMPLNAEKCQGFEVETTTTTKRFNHQVLKISETVLLYYNNTYTIKSVGSPSWLEVHDWGRLKKYWEPLPHGKSLSTLN